MAGDVKWIKVSTGIFDDEKILMIESMPGGYEILAVWFKLLVLAGKQNNSGVFMIGKMPCTTKLLSSVFRMKEATVKNAIDIFKGMEMVDIVDGVITIPKWGKHQNLDNIEKKREAQREYMREYRKKQKEVIQGSAENPQDDEEPEPEENPEDIPLAEHDESEHGNQKEKKKSGPTDAEVNAFFDKVWKLYPVKKGKAQVSMTQRKKLFRIGYDAMESAISRYMKELEKDSAWRKPQNGSTFFNSGHVDYLDENFVPDKEKTSYPSSPAPSYDVEAYEKAMMEELMADHKEPQKTIEDR